MFCDIPDHEIKEFNTVIQMTADDLYANEYEPHAFIKSQVERFGTLIGNVVGPILSGIDIDKIQEFINGIGGVDSVDNNDNGDDS